MEKRFLGTNIELYCGVSAKVEGFNPVLPLLASENKDWVIDTGWGTDRIYKITVNKPFNIFDIDNDEHAELLYNKLQKAGHEEVINFVKTEPGLVRVIEYDCVLDTIKSLGYDGFQVVEAGGADFLNNVTVYGFFSFEGLTAQFESAPELNLEKNLFCRKR